MLTTFRGVLGRDVYRRIGLILLGLALLGTVALQQLRLDARATIQDKPAAALAADAASVPITPVLAQDAAPPISAEPEPAALPQQIPGERPVVTADPFESMLASLRESLRVIQSLPAYTATLEQQVETDGVLHPPERIDLKLRRYPFSVYLCWERDHQEVLYVEGEHQGRLLVRPTRGLVALRGVWKLRPESSQAMRNNRYPLTQIGIEKLCDLTMRFHQDRHFSRAGMTCTRDHCLADGLPATRYTLEFESAGVCPQYARSILAFDDQTGLLIAMENHRWGENGAPAGLLEKYLYHSFRPVPDLSNDDFSDKNPAYHFQ